MGLPLRCKPEMMAALLAFLVGTGGATLVAVRKYTSSCTSDMDCSLNGKCGAGGTCTCSAGWGGAHCERLALLASARALGYHGATADGGTRLSSWGAAPMRGPDGTYHAILSEMDAGVGLTLWTCASHVVHATTPDPLTQPFVKRRVLWPVFAHEPRCAAVPAATLPAAATGGGNGTAPAAAPFVCFFAYNPVPGGRAALGPGCSGGNGSTPAGCRCDKSFRFRAPTAMSYTADIDSGKWSEPRVLDAIPAAPDSNMSPYVYPNGSLLALARNNAGSNIHIVTAGNWADPDTYTYHADDIGAPFFLPEDPFLWRDGEGRFHSLHHAYPLPYGPHAFSEDGRAWHTFWTGANASAHDAYSGRVAFADGSTVQAGCRERPSLVFGADGHTPLALMNGLSPDPSHVGDQPSGSCRFDRTDYSFTSLQHLRT
eukprot:g2911.t1